MEKNRMVGWNMRGDSRQARLGFGGDILLKQLKHIKKKPCCIGVVRGCEKMLTISKLKARNLKFSQSGQGCKQERPKGKLLQAPRTRPHNIVNSPSLTVVLSSLELKCTGLLLISYKTESGSVKWWSESTLVFVVEMNIQSRKYKLVWTTCKQEEWAKIHPMYSITMVTTFFSVVSQRHWQYMDTAPSSSGV